MEPAIWAEIPDFSSHTTVVSHKCSAAYSELHGRWPTCIRRGNSLLASVRRYRRVTQKCLVSSRRNAKDKCEVSSQHALA